jgi:hypothetical protein
MHFTCTTHLKYLYVSALKCGSRTVAPVTGLSQYYRWLAEHIRLLQNAACELRAIIVQTLCNQWNGAVASCSVLLQTFCICLDTVHTLLTFATVLLCWQCCRVQHVSAGCALCMELLDHSLTAAQSIAASCTVFCVSLQCKQQRCTYTSQHTIICAACRTARSL